MNIKPVQYCSPGVKQDKGKLLPILTVHFVDGKAANYVASKEFAYADVESMAEMWEAYTNDLKSRYNLEARQGWQAMTVEIIKHFNMRLDD